MGAVHWIAYNLFQAVLKVFESQLQWQGLFGTFKYSRKCDDRQI